MNYIVRKYGNWENMQDSINVLDRGSNCDYPGKRYVPHLMSGDQYAYVVIFKLVA